MTGSNGSGSYAGANTLGSADEILALARIFAGSKQFSGLTNEYQVAARIVLARELGISLYAAFTGLHLIEGKLGFFYPLLAGLVRRSGRYDYDVRVLEDELVEIDFWQLQLDSTGRTRVDTETGLPVRAKLLGCSKFSRADAQQAGLYGNDKRSAHSKFPRNMLFARAFGNGVRWYCPDVTGGAPAYLSEELGGEDSVGGEAPARSAEPSAAERARAAQAADKPAPPSEPAPAKPPETPAHEPKHEAPAAPPSKPAEQPKAAEQSKTTEPPASAQQSSAPPAAEEPPKKGKKKNRFSAINGGAAADTRGTAGSEPAAAAGGSAESKADSDAVAAPTPPAAETPAPTKAAAMAELGKGLDAVIPQADAEDEGDPELDALVEGMDQLAEAPQSACKLAHDRGVAHYGDDDSARAAWQAAGYTIKGAKVKKGRPSVQQVRHYCKLIADAGKPADVFAGTALGDAPSL